MSKMLDMLDDEIQYFGEEEKFDHDDNQEIPVEPRTKNGKKVPGNDRHWKMKRSFQNLQTLKYQIFLMK